MTSAVQLVVHGELDTAVQVDGEHALRACRHTAGAQRVAKAVVRDLVAQTAARAQRVGIGAHVGEERVALGIHLGREVAPFLVLAVALLVGEQGHRLDGERQQGLRALVVEPLHEALLQPGESLPVGLRAVGEVEVAEDGLEVVLVVVGDVPEHGLVVTGTCRLVQRVDNLLEVVGDHLVDGALLQTHVGLLVGTLPVVLTPLLANEVVHVHQELGRGTGAAEHRAHHEHHVHKTACKRLQIGGSRRVAADAGGTADEPGVHCDRGTVVGQRSLIIFINEVVSQFIDIFVGQFLAVHFFDTVSEQTTVQTDKVRFGQLADEGGDVLVLNVGISVVLRTGSSVHRLCVF